MLLTEMEKCAVARDHLRIAEVHTEADARRTRFIGSPTLRFDGDDLAETGDAAFALDCRIYYLRDGKVSPLPDPDDLADAVAAYATKHQSEGD